MDADDHSKHLSTRQRVRSCIDHAEVRSKTWLEVNGRFAIGEGGADLLRAIAAEGSLVAGARRIGWSYRHAWGYVREAERVLGLPLVTSRSGKGKVRGSLLTAEAGEILRLLRPARG